MEDLTRYRLVVDKGQEKFIPKHDISLEARWFNYDSLVRLYGQEAVDRYMEYSGNNKFWTYYFKLVEKYGEEAGEKLIDQNCDHIVMW